MLVTKHQAKTKANREWTIQRHWQEEFEDTKEVIRIRKFVKEREHNGQKKKDKRTNNDLPNTTQKTKDRAKRTQLKSGVNLGALEE